MKNFNLGDIVYHKVTQRKCVVSAIEEDNNIRVTTDADDKRVYKSWELVAEKDWKDENANNF